MLARGESIVVITYELGELETSMLHAPADSILSPTGTQSSEIWLLWIHSQGSQPSSPQAPAQPPESALT